MSRFRERKPRGYDGIEPSGRLLHELLPEVLKKIEQSASFSHAEIFKQWKELVKGEPWAEMATADSYKDQVLWVAVENHMVYSILATQEKPRLLRLLQEKLPKDAVKNVIFRLKV